MKKLVAAFLTLLCMVGSAQASEQAKPDSAAYVAEASAIIMDFMGRLKGELQGAMKLSGPEGAIGVCQQAAPDIGMDVGREHGWTVRRTALKLRNPANKPDDWERQVLEDFVRRTAEGADPATLSATRVDRSGDTRTFRFMKAIPMAEQPCSVCHGANVAPGLRAKIIELYPDDEAVGFAPGEIRGAFTLSRTMD